MRLAVLWSRMSGYISVCLKMFAERYDVELLVVVQPTSRDAPFEKDEFPWIKNLVIYQDGSDFSKLQKQVIEFRPDAILMCSWNFRDYMRITRSQPFNKLPRVAVMDNQWYGTIKQYIGVIASQILLKPSIDCFFVPGDRQAEFSRKLGYDRNRVVTGYYSCDAPRFTAMYETRVVDGALPGAFLFVGRMVAEKGILNLIDAYKLYRKQVSNPYPLICAGTGPLLDSLQSVEGVEVIGFVQPNKLPEVYAQASCLLLPSVFEPWGVVVHEATTAGLAVICTRSCGAAVHLVQEDYNGYIIRPGQPVELANAMIEYSKKTDTEKIAMSKRSHALSQQFSPDRWARALNKAIETARVQHCFGSS